MNSRKVFLLLIAFTEWFGLIAQLVLQQQSSQVPPVESLTRFFSYFTILTNLLVALYATSALFREQQRPALATGITYFITITGVVYNSLLRQSWSDSSSGLQSVLHDVLHTLTPLMMLIYWWIWVKAKDLRARVLSYWLIYPAAYTVYTLIRGAIVHWYPYFFLNVDQYGYARISLNCAGMLAGFLLLGWLFLLLARRKPI